jgi:hypothetical protein
VTTATYTEPAPLGRVGEPESDRVGIISLAPMMLRLHARALENAKGNARAALGIMGSVWGWFRSMLQRLAAALGVRLQVPAKPTPQQLSGEQPLEASVQSGRELVGRTDVESEAAAKAMQNEVDRLADHLVENGVDLDLLQSEHAKDHVERQLRVLAQYWRVYSDEAESAERQAMERVNLLATSLNTGVQALAETMRNGGPESAMYDRDGEIQALFVQAAKARESAQRTVAAAIALVQSTTDEAVPEATREFALQTLRKLMGTSPSVRSFLERASSIPGRDEESQIDHVSSSSAPHSTPAKSPLELIVSNESIRPTTAPGASVDATVVSQVDVTPADRNAAMSSSMFSGLSRGRLWANVDRAGDAAGEGASQARSRPQ